MIPRFKASDVLGWNEEKIRNLMTMPTSHMCLLVWDDAIGEWGMFKLSSHSNEVVERAHIIDIVSACGVCENKVDTIIMHFDSSECRVEGCDRTICDACHCTQQQCDSCFRNSQQCSHDEKEDVDEDMDEDMDEDDKKNE